MSDIMYSVHCVLTVVLLDRSRSMKKKQGTAKETPSWLQSNRTDSLIRSQKLVFIDIDKQLGARARLCVCVCVCVCVTLQFIETDRDCDSHSK
jgi:hypothetical protein